MTELQGAELIALLTTVRDLVESTRFVLQTLALSVGFLAGGHTWRLVVLGKNQRSLW